MSKPLEGVRVIDMSHVIAGPLASFYLAQLGAEVIKVEPPAGGEVMRASKDASEGDTPAGFVALNAGKRSLAQDIRTPQGAQVIRALAADRRVIPVVRRFLADGETPVGVYRKLAGDRPGTFLLESAEHGGVWSRYSIVGAASRATLTARDGEAHWVGLVFFFLLTGRADEIRRRYRRTWPRNLALGR